MVSGRVRGVSMCTILTFKPLENLYLGIFKFVNACTVEHLSSDQTAYE